MNRRRLIWQLYPSYFLITVGSVLAVAWFATRSLHEFYLRQTAEDLRVRAVLFSHQVLEAMQSGPEGEVDRVCKDLGRATGARCTVILPSGRVAGDSEGNPTAMDNHAHRREVAEALAGRTGVSTRSSETLRKNMMYVAVPLREGASMKGVVRWAMPLTTMEEHFRGVRSQVLLGGVVIGLFAALVCLVVARQISRPLVEMERGATRFAQGDLSARVPMPRTEEMARLATALNQMAWQLNERLRAVMEERNQKEALFAGMDEGVIAVDLKECLTEVNPAAARLFGVRPEAVQGRTIQETIRNAEVHRFVTRTLTADAPVEGEMTFFEDAERIMQARGSALRDESGRKTGALIVFNDVTRLKDLERVRRDFVANASHELKTPITSVKAAVETIHERAAELPEDLRPFAGMAVRQVERLGSLVEDLLSLARLEYESERHEVALEVAPLRPILESAIHACEARAAAKQISVTLECGEDLEARVHPPLMEQAVVNLIANAIQYSEAGTQATVRGCRAAGETFVQVVDQGCGIATQHLPRLFERFYRVDMARSRKLGGTGLGLAIVKHVALAHGGTVVVESAVGRGSTFTIRLPAAGPAKG